MRALLPLALLLAACVTDAPPPAPGDDGARAWRPQLRLPQVARSDRAARPARGDRAEGAPDAADLLLPQDREKVARLRQTVTAALFEGLAARRPDESALAASREVLTAGVLPLGPEPLVGAYRCRTLKHGGALAITAYRYWDCAVTSEGGDLILAKPSGSQRMIGRLMVSPSLGADGLTGLLYAGTEYGAGGTPAPYPDGERTEVGLFERIGEDRYRLMIPEPGIEGRLDVIDLVRA